MNARVPDEAGRKLALSGRPAAVVAAFAERERS